MRGSVGGEGGTCNGRKEEARERGGKEEERGGKARR